MITRLSHGGLLEDRVDPHKLVFRASPAGSLTSSSRSKWVKMRSGRKSRASRAGDGETQAREVVQLPERARERRLAALVRSGDDQDPLRVGQAHVVAHDGRVRDELLGEGQVEGVGGAGHPLPDPRNIGEAEPQTRRLEARDVLEVGEVELHLPVERRDRAIEIARMAGAMLREPRGKRRNGAVRRPRAPGLRRDPCSAETADVTLYSRTRSRLNLANVACTCAL